MRYSLIMQEICAITFRAGIYLHFLTQFTTLQIPDRETWRDRDVEGQRASEKQMLTSKTEVEKPLWN